MSHPCIKRVAVVGLLLLCSQAIWAQTSGTITKVIAFRGQALVTRQVDVNAKAGSQEFVVTNLPANVVSGSLYAEGDDNLNIRAVRYRITATQDEPNPAVSTIDTQIETLKKQIASISSQLTVQQQKTTFLDKLEGFTSASLTADTTKGTFDPKSLIETSNFLFQNRSDVAARILALNAEKDTATKALELQNRKRAELTQGTSKTSHEAVVFVDANDNKPSKLYLSYYVSGVSWSPSYNVRLSGRREQMTLDYQAQIYQMSGEDWNGVNLILSTTQPNMLASMPLLSPLYIQLTANAGKVDLDSKAYSSQRGSVEKRLKDNNDNFLNVGPQGAQGPQGQRGTLTGDASGLFDSRFQANSIAAEMQRLELAASDDAVKKVQRVANPSIGGLAVTYAIAGKVSLPSRNDQQLFRIAQIDMKSDFYYTSVPLLTEFIYQGVDVVNNSDYALLPGPFSSYLDGTFTGSGVLPLIARGQNFTVGFGTETQLRAERVLVDKSTVLNGGNKIMKYQYKLNIQNFMDKPARLRVFDRIPNTENNQVTITTPEIKPDLSKDASYLADEKEHGLLRWDVEIPAKSTGIKVFPISYKLEVQYDKSFSIGEIPAEAMDRMRSDLQAMMSAQNMY